MTANNKPHHLTEPLMIALDVPSLLRFAVPQLFGVRELEYAI